MSGKRPTYIDEEDIPASARRKYDWVEFFGEIPSGKARQISERELHYATVRQALERMKKMGRFKNYYIKTKRFGKELVFYVVNSKNK